MRSKIITIAALAAAFAVALAAAVALRPFSTQAATDDPSRITQPDDIGQLQASGDEDADEHDNDDSDEHDRAAKPYIGVAVRQTDSGALEVVEALDGSPADGALEAGDLITAVNGVATTGVDDLREAVESAGAGGAVALAVTRDGSDITVDVTVGEFEYDDRGRKFGRGWRGKRSLGNLWHFGSAGDWFVSAQMVTRDEDGNLTTKRAITGTVSNVDANARTFTLTPSDGSAAISYSVGDDAKILTSNGDALADLEADANALVMDVDGEAMLVAQGEWLERPAHHRFHKNRGGNRSERGMMFWRYGSAPRGAPQQAAEPGMPSM